MQIKKPEIFMEIQLYRGYEISNHGTVVSYKQGSRKILTPSPDKDGYLRVALSKNGKNKHFKVHRLVAIHFIPNPNNYPLVNHKNGDVTDNYYENLEWSTIYYNNKYDYNNLENNKDLQQGENKNFTTLTEKQIIEILYLLNNSKLTQIEIARKFNVSLSTIQKIKYGKTHTDISKNPISPVIFEQSPQLFNEDDDVINYFKLNENQTKEIFALSRMGIYTQSEIASIYGVCRQTVSDIKLMKIRSNITQDMINQNGLLKVVKFDE